RTRTRPLRPGPPRRAARRARRGGRPAGRGSCVRPGSGHGGGERRGPPAAGGDSPGVRSPRSPLPVIRELTADCVHCGFCLPTCPTYVLWGEEMDSPRGRIHLMDARLDGTVALNETVAEHFDRCLGCMACVSACPSGVRYDLLIESTRARVEREHRRPLGERAL